METRWRCQHLSIWKDWWMIKIITRDMIWDCDPIVPVIQNEFGKLGRVRSYAFTIISLYSHGNVKSLILSRSFLFKGGRHMPVIVWHISKTSLGVLKRNNVWQLMIANRCLHLGLVFHEWRIQGGGGGGNRRAPLKLDQLRGSTMFFIIQIVIRMLKIYCSDSTREH